MYRLALIKFKRKPAEAIMVGDQMMTDVFGANRAGIDAIWVRKMEGNEFKGTRINRAMERFLTGHVYEALISPVDELPGPEPKRTLQHQVVKFLVVGGTSFAINAIIRWILMFKIPYGNERMSVVAGHWLQSSVGWPFTVFDKPSDAFFPIACAIAASFAILNSFVWNRRWTFQIRGREERAAQLRRFVIVSLIGALLDLLISSFLNHIIAGDENRSVFAATVISAGLVAIWNFIGQRTFAFKAVQK
jgi:putative flippase GtrA